MENLIPTKWNIVLQCRNESRCRVIINNLEINPSLCYRIPVSARPLVKSQVMRNSYFSVKENSLPYSRRKSAIKNPVTDSCSLVGAWSAEIAYWTKEASWISGPATGLGFSLKCLAAKISMA